MKLKALAIFLALAPATAFAADTTAQATLKAPAPIVGAGVILDGRVWRCDGVACMGAASGSPASQPAVQECRRVAKKLGPVTAYSTGGRTLDAAALDACNR